MSTKGRKMRRVRNSTQSRTVNNTRGSQLWSYNHFRTSILTSLLNDLIDSENEGLEDYICYQIQKSLNYFINASTHIPGGGFLSGGPLYKEIESFFETYVLWNGVDGQEPQHIAERHKLLRKLREKRQKISDKVRVLQYEIENNLDQKILHDSYRAIGEMINMVPSVFVNLSSSYKDYIKIAAKNI